VHLDQAEFGQDSQIVVVGRHQREPVGLDIAKRPAQLNDPLEAEGGKGLFNGQTFTASRLVPDAAAVARGRSVDRWSVLRWFLHLFR
jgi:hypothetical protein